MKIGYARVSTDAQELGRQLEALRNAGCEEIYQEKRSGARNKERPELDKMLNRLQAGDIVIVQKLDRLGRSVIHLVGLMERFKTMGVEFKSLSDPIDTTSPAGRFIYQVLACVAEFEREIIKERVSNGIHYAQGQGVKMGRKFKDRTEEIKAVEGLSMEEAKEKGISKYKYYEARRAGKAVKTGEQ